MILTSAFVDGITLAINKGIDPKGNSEQMVLFYHDCTGNGG